MARDFRKMAMRQDFAELCRMTSRPTTIPVSRPNKKHFFRVHPGEDWTMAAAIYEDDAGARRNTYYVDAAVFAKDAVFRELCIPVILFFCQYRMVGDAYFIWPAKQPTGGPGDSWHNSALMLADEAKTEWRRMIADQSVGGYKPFRPEEAMEEPEWPSEWDFNDALNIAFGESYVIDSCSHDVVMRARGKGQQS